MASYTTNWNLKQPQTGEPDLAQDVASNMDTIDEALLTDTELNLLTNRDASVANADTLHKHNEVAQAVKLKTARTINGIAFDGTANITIVDNTKATSDHKHIYNSGSITEVNGDTINQERMRRIYVGTSLTPSTDASTNSPNPTPSEGDIYIRII